MVKAVSKKDIRLSDKELRAVVGLIGNHILSSDPVLDAAYCKLADDFNSRGIGIACDVPPIVALRAGTVYKSPSGAHFDQLQSLDSTDIAVLKFFTT